MSSELVTQGVWNRLTRAAKKTRRPGLAAVAYFGKGASKLLPMRSGSRIVVDASEAAVTSGQTYPGDLEKLVQRGVRVFSVPNLHAKLFVFGNRAYIGSANASQHSAGTLLEAIVVTTDRDAVKAARAFVRGLCLHELGPEALSVLKKLYKPPRWRGRRAKRRKTAANDARPDLPKLRIAQIMRDEPPEGTEEVQRAGEKAAKTKRKKRRTHVLEDIWKSGDCPYHAGDTLIQVIEEENGQKFVSPPANILHTKMWKKGRKRVTFTYLEVPDRRRIHIDRLAKRLGYGAKKQLGRSGQIRKPAFAEKLLAAWDR